MNTEMKTWRVIATPENAEYGDESWFVILDDPDIPDDYPIILWEYDLAAAEGAVRYLNMLEAKASHIENRGWTYLGRRHHRAIVGHLWFHAACDDHWLDQTTLSLDGSVTGALVPKNLSPCKKKACR